LRVVPGAVLSPWAEVILSKVKGLRITSLEGMVPARLFKKFNYVEPAHSLPDPLLERPCPREDISLDYSPIGTFKGFQSATLDKPLHPQLLGGQLPFTNVPSYLLQGTPKLAGYFLERELVGRLNHSHTFESIFWTTTYSAADSSVNQ